jgi:hypothetical protein
MAGRTSDWKGELERFLKPFLAQLGHEAPRRMCPVYGLASQIPAAMKWCNRAPER